ncbi:NAD(P)-dependent alcohol dehydrogenase [Pseudonocardia ailaonensis]
MRAIVQDRYGDASVLRPAEIEKPEPGEGEVVVHVHAAGLDRGAWHLMAGLPLLVRPAFGLRAPKEPVRGREFAGRVEAIGAGVTGLAPGDEVAGVGEGCFAELARARVDRIAPAPAGLGPVDLAALPISGLTALQAVRDQARVEPGQRVLVIGASGGVGSLAVQIAKARGAHVTGTASPGKLDLVRELGAEPMDHTRPLTGVYDAVLDAGGHRPLRRLLPLLTPRGTLVIIGSEPGGRLLGGTDRQLRALLLSPVVRRRLRSFVSSENAADLRELFALAEAGTIRAVVGETLPLDELPEAMRRMVAGATRGKVVLVP